MERSKRRVVAILLRVSHLVFLMFDIEELQISGGLQPFDKHLNSMTHKLFLSTSHVF